jgi:hypothetical protein
MNDIRKFRWMVLPITLASLLGVRTAAADVVTDWSVTAADITVASGQGPPVPKPNRRHLCAAKAPDFRLSFAAGPAFAGRTAPRSATGTIKLRGLVAGQPYERDIAISHHLETCAESDVLALLNVRCFYLCLVSRQRIDVRP